MKIDKAVTAGLACQIVWDYTDWSDEHVGAMLDTYEDTGEAAPCDYDTLVGACHSAAAFKREGNDIIKTGELLQGKL